jgi:hypothetical protein
MLARTLSLTHKDLPTEERLIEVYTRILETAQTPDFTLIVTGYAQFNEVTDLCDSMSLALLDPLPIFRPPLVKAIRARLNALVRGINAVIDRTVEAVNKRYVDKHIHYFSIDGLFDTHRLCDADPATGHDNEEWRNDAWFYTLVRNTDPLPAGRISSLQAAQESDDVADLGYVDLSDCPAEGTEEDTDFGLACMVLRQIYANQEEPGTGTPPRGSPLADVLGFFFKSFHPKQQAHDVSASVRQHRLTPAMARSCICQYFLFFVSLADRDAFSRPSRKVSRTGGRNPGASGDQSRRHDRKP